MMRLGFAHFLRDGSPLYVNPWAVQSLESAPDQDDRTRIVFANGDSEIVKGYVENIASELERAAASEE
jgi:uncharacterized protein YlzI (FlbEa/FlbD family)